jgi:hypothetical protein
MNFCDEFSISYPGLNKTFLTLWTSFKEGIGGGRGERRAQRQGEDRVTLMKTLIY